MKLNVVIFSTLMLLVSTATAAPIATDAAMGGFLSWRDCRAAEQFFCDGGLGGSTPAFNNNSGDRSVTGDLGSGPLGDSFAGAADIGHATYAVDMLNSGLGVSMSASAFSAAHGRTAASVGGYQGLTYNGAGATTRTLSVSMDYDKGADGDQLVPGSSAAYARLALVTTSTNTMIGDPDVAFLGTTSIGRETAFDIAFAEGFDADLIIGNTYSVGLNTFTVADYLELSDPAAGVGTINGSLSISLNTGDTFFLVAVTQTVGNQSGLNAINLTSAFDDTSNLQALAVPAPAGVLVLALGLLVLGARKLRPA